jgi:hypothetical protein
MDYFETVNIRGKYLGRAFEYFSIFQPTSVESEHAFSAAGLFCTKIRSRLSDETLRAHFLRILSVFLLPINSRIKKLFS